MKNCLGNIRQKVFCSLLTVFCLSNFYIGQSQNLENIALEFTCDNINVEGVSIIPAEIQGQLFYSKMQGGLITKNYKSFNTDKSLVTVSPLIRIFKTFNSDAQNLYLTISLQTIDIVGGKEKRTMFHSMFDRKMVISNVMKKVDKEEQYIIHGDGDESKSVGDLTMLKITHNSLGLDATYIESLYGMVLFKYRMKGIKITIQDGKKVD